MATPTSRLALTKSTSGEPQDIDVLNANFDTIDSNVGAAPVTSGTMPTSPYNGQIVKQTDTAAIAIYDAASATWRYFDTEWQSYTPTIYVGAGTVVIGNGTLRAKYFRSGKKVKVRIYFEIGSTTSYNLATGQIVFSLPPGYATDTTLAGGIAEAVGLFRAAGAGGIYQGFTYVISTSPSTLLSVVLVGPAASVANNNVTVTNTQISAVGHYMQLEAEYATT